MQVLQLQEINATPATDARFNNINAIASDFNDDLYVTDNNNNSIRKLVINKTTGVYEAITIATTSSTILSGIAVDLNRAVYFTDNRIIYKLTANNANFNSYTMTTIAGTVTGGFTDGVGTAATFSNIKGVTADSFGNLYITDGGSQRICIVTPNSDGTYTTTTIFGQIPVVIIGDGVATIDSDLPNGVKGTIRQIQGISVDPNNNIYIVSTGSHMVRVVVGI